MKQSEDMEPPGGGLLHFGQPKAVPIAMTCVSVSVFHIFRGAVVKCEKAHHILSNVSSPPCFSIFIYFLSCSWTSLQFHTFYSLFLIYWRNEQSLLPVLIG